MEELVLYAKKDRADKMQSPNERQFDRVGASLNQQWVKRVVADRRVHFDCLAIIGGLIGGYFVAWPLYAMMLTGAVLLVLTILKHRRLSRLSDQDKRANELGEIISRLGPEHQNLAQSMTSEKNRLLSNWQQFRGSDFPFSEQIEAYEREAYRMILLLQERRIEIDRLEKRNLVEELSNARIKLRSAKPETPIRESLERRARLLAGQQSILIELNNSVELIELQIQNIADFYSLMNSKTVAMPGETTIELKHLGEEIDVLAESIDQTKRLLEEVDRKVLGF